ncbi:MAG TPA: hypothetical protein VNQ79_06815 [Blastocatellia bacterium]|nr:hypothetical protein [Blastocatellia bacterium]
MQLLETQEECQRLEDQYPAVSLAYDLAISSYETALKRLETVESRAQSLLTLGITVSLPVAPIASANRVPFNSKWFIIAVVAFGLAISMSMFARFYGRVILLHPSLIYSELLHCSEWEFKKNIIHYAGGHFEANRTLAARRSLFIAIAAILFLLEGVALAVWVSVCHP